MPNYQLGKVYEIKSPNCDKRYIGSTCQQYLSSRLSGHISAYKLGKGYMSSFEIIKAGDCYINLIETFPCNSKEELQARERYHIDRDREGVVNLYIPTRTHKEWREENKEKIAQRKKEYTEANKEVIFQKNKEYTEANKEKIAQKQKEWREANKEVIFQKKKDYREANKEKIAQKKKEDYEANKEVISQKHKEYYEANRERLNQKGKEYYEANKEKQNKKCVCECSLEYTHSHKKRHETSARHKSLLEKLNST